MSSVEKVAITGGAGFIGSHLAKRLMKEGKEVKIIDSLSSGSSRNLADVGVSVPIVTGDLKNYGFAKESLNGIDTVYHLAADIGNVVYLHGSNVRELAAMQKNIIIDTNVLQACVENNVGTVIYASSVSVYSYKQQLTSHAVFKEEDSETNVNPEGGYGWAKYIGEKQLELSDMKYGIARIFHAYGPNIDVSDTRAQVIASLIKKAINYPKEEFVVWGDGTQKRCFVYIDDVIDAVMKLRNHIGENGNLIVNIGSRDEVTVEQLANEIIRISGKEMEIKYDTSKPKGANSRMPDLERAANVLGWKPTTPLNKGLEATYGWASKRLGTM